MVKSKKGKGGAGNPAFMRPVQPDDVLGASVGTDPLPRTQITKKLWEYIHENKLQDKKDKRRINANKTLKKFFGGKDSITMFEMSKCVSAHVEKID